VDWHPGNVEIALTGMNLALMSILRFKGSPAVKRYGRLGMVAGVALSWLAMAFGSQGAKEPAVVNPHWTRDQCLQCHTEVDDEFEPIAPESITGICTRCHDGVKAAMEKHPVGRPAKRVGIQTPSDWPTPGDRLSCVTCHDVLLAAEHSSQDRGANPAFLRGEPRGASIAFCGTCHAPAGHAKFNPHRMLTVDGAIAADQCRFCHAQEMPRDISIRTGDPRLVADEITLCARCHGLHPDFFEPGHIGRTVPKPMLDVLRHGSRADGGSAVTDLLPLADSSRIVCSTCHNPHQAGLFAAGAPLAAGAMDFDNGPVEFALRASVSHSCTICHFR